MDQKQIIHRYLSIQRDTLLAKLDGLGERDVRWPMTPTGTNLLGLVKHVASVELGYFGVVFDRPSDVPLLWLDDDAEINADMWATADESREEIVALYQQAATPRRCDHCSPHAGLARSGSVVAFGAGASHPASDHGARECGDGSARRPRRHPP
jgi:hypothetical protein